MSSTVTPARQDEDPASCATCKRRDEGVWLNERWRLARVNGVGVPRVVRVVRRLIA